MKIGIMQPYFFPYIGYWQLIYAVDTFVVYDDVNYINSGWINRNNILLNDKKFLITLPLYKSSIHKKINEIEITNEHKIINKMLKSIEQSYKKAPFYNQAFNIISNTLLAKEKSLANILYNSITSVCNYLEIKTNIIKSSEIAKNNDLKGQEKIIEIVKSLDGKQYINAIGGQELYKASDFREQNIYLNFLKTKDIEYKQWQNKFIPHLSIIDVMMFNPKSKIQEMLNEFELI